MNYILRFYTPEKPKKLNIGLWLSLFLTIGMYIQIYIHTVKENKERLSTAWVPFQMFKEIVQPPSGGAQTKQTAEAGMAAKGKVAG